MVKKIAWIVSTIFLLTQPIMAQPAGAGAVVPDEVARRALVAAREYADVTYEFGGELRQGVAYKWGGRSSVAEFLTAVSQGAVPGEDAGVDASAVVVNAYLAAHPDHRFKVVWDGAERHVTDATSADLYRWNVRLVSPEHMRPGDLIFFQNDQGHVNGVAVFERREGPNVHFIVASAGSGKVVSTFLNVNNAYWNTRVKAVGQLLATIR